MEKYKKFTILIVDDEEDLRDSIAYDFERNGFTVLSAKDGIEAFEFVKSTVIDLVISDIRMPNSDGIQLLENIHTYNPHTPKVILITGYSSNAEQACIEKGALKVFSKPFDRQELMGFVLNALGLRRLEKDPLLELDEQNKS